MFEHIKNQKLMVGAVSLVSATMYGIADYDKSDGISRSMTGAVIIGGALGAALGAAVAMGIGMSRGVGATPMSPIFASLGASLPLLIELPALLGGSRKTTNEELIRNVFIGGLLGSTIGLAIDFYRGQM